MSESVLIAGTYEVYAVFEWVNGVKDDEDPILLKLFTNLHDANTYRWHLIRRENLTPDTVTVEEVSVCELAKEAPTF